MDVVFSFGLCNAPPLFKAGALVFATVFAMPKFCFCTMRQPCLRFGPFLYSAFAMPQPRLRLGRCFLLWFLQCPSLVQGWGVVFSYGLCNAPALVKAGALFFIVFFCNAPALLKVWELVVSDIGGFAKRGPQIVPYIYIIYIYTERERRERCSY